MMISKICTPNAHTFWPKNCYLETVTLPLKCLDFLALT
jgi:hypothetical protein